MRAISVSTIAAVFAIVLANPWAAHAAPAAPSGALAPPAPMMAIIIQDQTRLQAAPRDAAQQQAVLSFGEVVEVRGERMDYVQVYDHKRERAGYVRAAQLRRSRFLPEESAELLSVVRFVRDQAGAEALGIGYVAAYLKAATAAEINNESGAEVFDALGVFAERLASRASAKTNNATVAAHLDLASAYGLNFKSIEQGDRMLICYDGDAFARVLAISKNAERRARAALALTREDCLSPALRPLERAKIDEWRVEVLARIDTTSVTLPAYLKNRVQLRRASILAGNAYQQIRQDSASIAQVSAQRAIFELANVTKGELTDEDLPTFNDASMRVNASRWAAEAILLPSGSNAKFPVSIITEAGQPGETCVLLVAADGKTGSAAKAPLARRCTYGVVWTSSATVNREGNTLALAVQPMAAWRELWVFRKDAKGWSVGVLPPATTNPEIGYAEFAGWVPGGKQMLVAREARGEGKYKRSFEVVSLNSFVTERQAGDPTALGAFQRWQDAGWVRSSVSVR